MNRVFIGAIALLVFIGIIFFAFRTVSALRLGRLFQRDVPQVGKLIVPSGMPLPSEMASPSTFSMPSVSPASSGIVTSPRPSGFVTVSPRPSPTVYTPTTGGKLPATGL